MKDKKILLITGASSDIGSSMIPRIAANYETVIAHYCHEKKRLENMQQEIGEKLVLVQADFSDAKSVAGMIKQIQDMGYSPNHIVHLAAAKIDNLQFHKDDRASFSIGMEISLHSIVDILQAFIPAMAKNRYGKILFMLSSVTLDRTTKFQSPYIVAKYALLGLMKSLSKEYAGKGIAVNGISPDMMETDFLSEIPELIIQKNAAESPLGRNLSIDDVIPAFQYLLSDEADAVMGQNIGITGGI